MALANKATYVTKYAAGGSGDNIIPDGFIKTVEKVWVDTYVYSSAATIGTGMVIDIAVIPQGKKITGIEVYGVGGATLSATSTNAISIGARYGTGAVTNATQFLGATTLGALAISTVGGTAGTTSMFILSQFQPLCANAGLAVELTAASHTIFLQFTAASPSITAGTIITKVRYT